MQQLPDSIYGYLRRVTAIKTLYRFSVNILSLWFLDWPTREKWPHPSGTTVEWSCGETSGHRSTARQAELAKAPAALAFNSRPSVPESTRERIAAIAAAAFCQFRVLVLLPSARTSRRPLPGRPPPAMARDSRHRDHTVGTHQAAQSYLNRSDILSKP
jgi:hypothetical protein